jgi:hypothetical protein
VIKAHLLYRNQDLDWKWVLGAAAERETTRTGRRYHRNDDLHFVPRSVLPWNAEALTEDLALNTVFEAMAQGDDCVFEAAKMVILAGVKGDFDTIRYRQHILQDCLSQAAVIRELYTVAVEAMDKQKGHHLGLLARYPDWVLRDATERMTTLLVSLKNIRTIAELHAHKFVSEGWSGFFAMLENDLSDGYFSVAEDHLNQLRFGDGEVVSAELAKANKGSGYVLHRTPTRRGKWAAWWTSLFEEKPPGYSFEIHPRDEAGFQALAALRNRGIGLAANVLGQAANHVSDFFGMLRAELAFYIGCLNLHERLVQKGGVTCIPFPALPEEQRLTFRGLYDPALALTMDRPVVGNEANGDAKALFLITGPNAGGKSTFLRSIGLAQLMMQSGMFVPADSFCGSLCDGVFTHFKREEDAAMQSGKFDEELARMSQIADHIARHSMMLLNESFAATNEREGSEIARQIVAALLEKDIRVLYVTHMYELARRVYERRMENVLFLRAVRRADGTRTFKLIEGEPLPTSFGEDLYDAILQADAGRSSTKTVKVRASAG